LQIDLRNSDNLQIVNETANTMLQQYHHGKKELLQNPKEYIYRFQLSKNSRKIVKIASSLVSKPLLPQLRSVTTTYTVHLIVIDNGR
jgi:hypothetical protein